MSTRRIFDRRLAFAFPGVGVRLCGHEHAFFGRHRDSMTPPLAEASNFAEFNYVAFMNEAERPLAMTELQGQLFTYAFNCAVAMVFQSHGAEPTFMAGHSMGIYSALATAGVVSFSDGLEIVAKAFDIVNESAAGLDASMAVVVGLGRQEVDELLAEQGSETTARRVNENNDTTTIFAGLTADLDGLLEDARRHDALKARLLPVNAPYHHPELLPEASERFRHDLQRFEWSAACCPIVSSIDQTLMVEPEKLLDLTARNITTPISWEAVVRTLVTCDIELIIECGAGISLHQNGRLMPECPQFVTVKNAQPRVGL